LRCRHIDLQIMSVRVFNYFSITIAKSSRT
jgi:hypothetical protein